MAIIRCMKVRRGQLFFVAVNAKNSSSLVNFTWINVSVWSICSIAGSRNHLVVAGMTCADVLNKTCQNIWHVEILYSDIVEIFLEGGLSHNSFWPLERLQLSKRDQQPRSVVFPCSTVSKFGCTVPLDFLSTQDVWFVACLGISSLFVACLLSIACVCESFPDLWSKFNWL